MSRFSRRSRAHRVSRNLLVERPHLTVTSPNRRGCLFKVRSRNTSISRIARNIVFAFESNRLPIYTGHLHRLYVFSVEVCHAMVFRGVGRIAGGDGETNGWKLDGERLTKVSAYHDRQSISPSAEL